jgi:hypothetical protein
MKHYGIISRVALLSGLLLALCMHHLVAQVMTETEAKDDSFKREGALMQSVIDDIRMSPLCIQSRQLSSCSDSVRAKLEDMVELQLAPQGRPFDPAVLAGATVQLTIAADGHMGLEMTRLDGEKHVWMQVPCSSEIPTGMFGSFPWKAPDTTPKE